MSFIPYVMLFSAGLAWISIGLALFCVVRLATLTLDVAKIQEQLIKDRRWPGPRKRPVYTPEQLARASRRLNYKADRRQDVEFFLSDECKLHSRYVLPSATLYDHYLLWCKKNDRPALGHNAFSSMVRHLAEVKFVRATIAQKQRRCIAGLTLKTH